MTPLPALGWNPPRLPDDCEAVGYDAHLEQWGDIVAAYEAAPEELDNAYLYLAQHPMFWELRQGTDVEWYLMPGTAWYRAIEMGVYRDQNTGEIQVWMEATPQRWHSDPQLNDETATGVSAQLGVSMDTFEDAATVLARMVHDTWGNDRETLMLEERWRG